MVEVTPPPLVASDTAVAFLQFKRLTHVPIDRRCIDVPLLGADAVAWLDTYHRDVWERISPSLRGEAAFDWLERQTAPIAP